MVGVLGTTPTVQAQETSLRSTQRPVRVVVDPTFQYYETEAGRELTELSTRLTVFVPIGDRFSVQAGGNYAQMDGDNLTEVSGFADATARITYAQPVGEGSVVFSARANLPTGKDELDEEEPNDELRTTRFISQNFYDFRVTSFSRGLSVSPQVTWAFPLTDRLAVGIGGGYQYQAGYRPQASLSEDYVPGDGIGVNGGLDYKITDASALGLDVAFRQFGTDRVGNTDQFDAGTRMAGTLRYLVRSGFTTVRAVLRFTRWEESKFRFQQGDSNEAQVLPSNGLGLLSYQTRLTEDIRLHVRGSGHWYEDTIQEDEQIFGRAYVSPSFEFSEVVSVEPHGTATYGSYVAFGGGVRIVGKF